MSRPPPRQLSPLPGPARKLQYHAEAGFLELVRDDKNALAVDRIGDNVLKLLMDNGRCVRRHVVLLAAPQTDLLFLRVRPRTVMDAPSVREREIAGLIAGGRTHKEIAKALRISPTTARNHMAAIHAKAAARNNAEQAGKLLNLD